MTFFPTYDAQLPQACEHLHATDGGHVVQHVLGQEAPPPLVSGKARSLSGPG